jgi:hypothetical protein
MDQFAKVKFLLLFLLLPGFAQAQVQDMDNIYVDYIRSVRMSPNNILMGMPIIDLHSNTQLFIMFDDLSDEVKNFTYTVVHCDADWQPSGLTENEYINGFLEDRIMDFDFSANTRTNFVYYYFAIPNRNMSFSKSGNYLLKVYEDDREKTLVFVRRFMIAERVVQVLPQVVRPSMVSKGETHQEIDFFVNHRDLNIRNPLLEVKATVLQNGRWDNAVTGIIPLFSRPGEMSFDFQDKIVFEAGKEFRSLDLRSMRYPSGDVAAIEVFSDGIDITLGKDIKRSNQVYLQYQDLNGHFVIESADMGDQELSADYARALFTLHSPTEYADADVYLFGRITDWRVKPEFRLDYNRRIQAYMGEILLKQGWYNYYYVVVPRKGGPPSIQETEGNWFETENQYTILVYYRPFGERFDRLVGVSTFPSR